MVIKLNGRDNPVVNYVPSGAMHLRTIGIITQPLFPTDLVGDRNAALKTWLSHAPVDAAL